MKTGRLLKFHRPDGEVHAYLFDEAEAARAVLYLMAPGHERGPVHEVRGASSEEVEQQVRAWIDARYPRTPLR